VTPTAVLPPQQRQPPQEQPPPSSFFTGQQQSSFLQRRPAATGVAAPSSVTPTAPAESFPSPLQESAPSSSSRDQCTPAKTPPFPRQVNFPSPSFYFRHLSFLLHAEHSVCMQEDGGKIIPPVGFLCRARLVLAQLVLLLGQADPGPALPSGSGLAQKRNTRFLLGQDRPNTF